LATSNAQKISVELQSEIANEQKSEKPPVIIKSRKIKKNT
jgi:hypothetical protein